MGLFTDTNPETFRVTLDDGWVELRSVVTQGDRAFADRKASSRVTSGSKKQQQANADEGIGYEFSTPRYISALIFRLTVAWSEGAEPSIENIERMPGTYIDAIMEEVNARNTERSDDEEAPLDSSSTDASESQPDSGTSELTPVGRESLAISP